MLSCLRLRDISAEYGVEQQYIQQHRDQTAMQQQAGYTEQVEFVSQARPASTGLSNSPFDPTDISRQNAYVEQPDDSSMSDWSWPDLDLVDHVIQQDHANVGVIPAIGLAAADAQLRSQAEGRQIAMHASCQGLSIQQIRSVVTPASNSPEASSFRQLQSHYLHEGVSSAVEEQAQLIGSTKLLQQLADMFRGGARHIMIIGGPGMGKTSLARAFGQQQYAQGCLIVFVALRDITNASETLAEVSHAIAVAQDAVPPLYSSNQAHLGCRAVTQQVCARLLSHPEQEVLLILDNADDIIGSTDMVHALAKEGLNGMERLANSDRLRRCIEPSLNSLPSERAALACLTMFPASFDSTAAAAVLGSDMSAASWTLRLLQNRSLVSAEAKPDSRSSGQQYCLHPFIPLKTLLCWARTSGSAEAVLAAREQLAYVQSRDPKTCQEANAELLSVLHTRQATSGTNSYTLVPCLESLANAAVLMGCSGQTTIHKANQACDQWRGQLVSMLEASKGRGSSQYLRAAAWVAYGLNDNDDSVKQLRALWADAVQALGSHHPATLAIQSQFAINLSMATRKEMLITVEPLREHLGRFLHPEDGLPDSIVGAWLGQHLQQCQEQLGQFDNDTVFAQLSFGTFLTRCSGAAERSHGMDLIAEGMQQAEVLWGKNDEYTLNAQLDVHAAALQRLWKLEDALVVVDTTMQLSKQEFGPISTYIGTCMQSKAKLLQHMGRYSECERTLEHTRQQVQAAQIPNSDSIELTLAQSGVYLDMAENLSLQGRHTDAEAIHRLSVQVLEGNHDEKCRLFSAHCLGLATALRQAGDMHGAEHRLQQADAHSSSDDCSCGLYALERARLTRDSGHAEAALSGLEEFYEYIKYCDEDSRMVVIDIALEIAWGWFLASKWVDAKVWFSKSCEMPGDFSDALICDADIISHI
ncbi:MAG: hypothetical protein FRX49_10853 [Trebouxia sp. A1-2]|nr:MAG: hypothetical protein FRX49_10853 [Trebouxia sp. A1-2]